jgi:uncharacterized protein
MSLKYAAILVMALACTTPAGAQQGAAREDGLTTVSLVESAQRDVQRDRLRIQLRVEQTGADATRVQGEINRRMAAALEKVRAAAADGRQLRAESGGYWIYQERPQEAPARWRGAQQLSLVGTDTATLLPLAAQLQQDGFLMSGINWELSNEARRGIEDELTTEAIERLRARSRFVAAAMEAQIVRFDRISIGTTADRPAMLQRGPMPMGAAAAGPAGAPVAAEPGLETVQIGVQAEILVKQKQ